jgi:hypothetical protein
MSGPRFRGDERHQDERIRPGPAVGSGHAVSALPVPGSASGAEEMWRGPLAPPPARTPLRFVPEGRRRRDVEFAADVLHDLGDRAIREAG